MERKRERERKWEKKLEEKTSWILLFVDVLEQKLATHISIVRALYFVYTINSSSSFIFGRISLRALFIHMHTRYIQTHVHTPIHTGGYTADLVVCVAGSYFSVWQALHLPGNELEWFHLHRLNAALYSRSGRTISDLCSVVASKQLTNTTIPNASINDMLCMCLLLVYYTYYFHHTISIYIRYLNRTRTNDKDDGEPYKWKGNKTGPM